MLSLPTIHINILSPAAQIKYFQIYLIALFFFNICDLPHGIGQRRNSQKQIFKEKGFGQFSSKKV